MASSHEFVIVGGGVFGCAVAYELAKRSRDVLLIDKALPGRATSASAGGLWPIGEAVGLGCGVIYHAMQVENGEQASDAGGPEAVPAVFRDFLVASNLRFPELSRELLEISGVDMEYEPGPGLLFAMNHESEREFVDQVVAGLPAGTGVEILSPEEVVRREPNLSPTFIGAALIHGEHQVNPMLLAEAYKRAALKLGATFRPDSQVTGFRRRGDQVVGVELGDEFISAGTVINAAGSWAGRLAATADITIPVTPIRGQVVLTESMPELMDVCVSTSNCYLAQKKHGEVLIGSTTEHMGFDVSVTDDAVRRLCQGAVQAVPMLRDVRIKRIWAGLRPGTPDELPILGAMHGIEGYVNATGGFRTGIVASPMAGAIIAQAIFGEELSFELAPFLAARFGVSALAT
ncbi:MAG: hydrogen cyanide synthase HcnC [Chlamydiales bacterium]|jgi:hydrogen cyanide synthase HcnC